MPANTETLFRVIQSIPSPKVETLKRWLTMLGEATTTKLHRDRDSQGIAPLKKDAQDGGAVSYDPYRGGAWWCVKHPQKSKPLALRLN